MLLILFISFVGLYFIPIRNVPVLSVAPVNLVVYLFLIFSMVNMRKTVLRLSGALFLVLFIFLCFSLLDSFDSYLKMEATGKLFGQIRGCIFMTAIAVFAGYKKNFIFAYKTILLLITFSVFLGLLIYFFGEPFQSIRMMVLGNADTYIQVKGSRIAGFSTSIFSFSYQLATAVVLSFGVYLEEKKFRWLLIFCLMVVGVILNGERSSALMAFLALMFMLSFHFRNKIKVFFVLVLSLLLVVVVVKQVISPPKNNSAHYESLLYRLENKREGEFLGRTLQGLAGVMTVLKNPLIGATNQQYQKEVHSLFRKYANSRVSGLVEIPAPHNHYVNVGMHAGIPGVLLCLFFLLKLWRLIKITWRKDVIRFELRTYYLAVCYALLAVLGNALFHNHGIFFAETGSMVIVGLLGAASMIDVEG